MSEIVIPQANNMVSSFGKRNANTERIAKEEAELAEMLRSGEPIVIKEASEAEPESAEERSFKKRYGDLRRYSQEQQSTLQKQVDALQAQLQQSTAQQIKLPKTEEELSAWAEAYPDVAKIVETIAMKKAKEQSSALEDRFKALDEREKLTAREKAETQLMKLHPDFDTIRDSDEFHDWVDEQPKWVQASLYENDTDSVAAARAIDLYKSDKGIRTGKKDTSYSDAAKSIGTRSAKSAPTGDDQSGAFSESQVAKMTIQQYEANMDAINKQRQTGKFIYDISGNAR
jgi:hypothetical protein